MKITAINPATRASIETWNQAMKRWKRNRKKNAKGAIVSYDNFQKALEQAIKRMDINV